MNKLKLPLISLLLACFIFVLHYFGLKYFWYWNYRWFDTPMHLLGGFWLSITSLWFASRLGYLNSIKDYKTKCFFIVLISVIIIGLSWEFFELFAGVVSFHKVGYIKGTIIDFANDIIGGLFAYLFFVKRKECLNKEIIKLETDIIKK